MWKNRILYAFILLVAIFLLLFYHHYFFFLLVLCLIVVPIAGIFIAKMVAKQLEFNLVLPVMTIEEGNYAKIVFKLKNDLHIPLPRLVCVMSVENRYYPNEEIQEMTFPVRGGNSTYEWSICPIYAGSISVKVKKVSVWDYLNFCEIKMPIPKEKELISLPKQSVTAVHLLETFAEEGDEIEMDALNSTEDVTSIKELRDYRPGDRLQRVHWKLSTKQDGLLVKEFERELNRTVTLLLDLQVDQVQVGNLDLCMRAFYSIAMYMLEEDQVFQIKWYDIDKKMFCNIRIESLEKLEDAMQQIFRVRSYSEPEAYRHYMQEEKGTLDMAIYFTDKSFHDYEPQQLLGVFENKVLILCL